VQGALALEESGAEVGRRESRTGPWGLILIPDSFEANAPASLATCVCSMD
jgi:hypothetical protein